MILIRFLVPLLFLLLVTVTYGVMFDINIYDSLAPSFFVQILVCLVTAIFFESFQLGIILSLSVSIVGFVFLLVVNESAKTRLCGYIVNNRFGIFLFCFLYFLIFVLNYGKYFCDWDEFSHWGLFVKEILRTDKLYCASDLQIVHKDYVPAISAFEALYCKLSFRFSEADAYRGIQVLQASMLFPLLKIDNNAHNDRKTLFETFLKLVIVFGVPMYFGNFYHTIYQDLIYGVIIYYCVYLVLRTDFDSAYRLFSLNLALIVLILTKQTASAFVLMVVCLLVAFELKRGISFGAAIFRGILSCAVPISFLLFWNCYVRQFVEISGEQSFGGVRITRILSILVHDGSISYQLDVERQYIRALLSKGIVQSISYVWMVLILVLVVIWLYFKQDQLENKSSLKLLGVWIIISSAAYAGMMWLLYLMAFSEYEARVLASYGRYMNTYLLAVSLIVLACYFMYQDGKLSFLNKIVAFIILENLIVFIGVEQLFPGFIYGEVQEYTSEADAILKNVSQNEKVYIIACGNSGSMGTTIAFRCSPISVSWGSIGTPRSEGDIWSQDLSQNELRQLLQEYDYVYLLDIDDVFLDEYSDVFDNISSEYNHRLFSIDTMDDTIVLRDCL